MSHLLHVSISISPQRPGHGSRFHWSKFCLACEFILLFYIDEYHIHGTVRYVLVAWKMIMSAKNFNWGIKSTIMLFLVSSLKLVSCSDLQHLQKWLLKRKFTLSVPYMNSVDILHAGMLLLKVRPKKVCFR